MHDPKSREKFYLHAPHAPRKFSLKTRSLSFSLHRRRSRRQLPPATMAKKKPPKKQPSGRLPTGVAKPPAPSPKSPTPDFSSAVKSKTKSDSSLAGPRLVDSDPLACPGKP